VQAYIFRTASNLSIDLARRQRLLPFLENGEEVLDHLVDEAPSPERVVMSRQELSVLQAALNQVPQTPRSVFLLRLDGCTFEDIGRFVGIRLRPPSARWSGDDASEGRSIGSNNFEN
jgi:RNA polymerase sigma-70 factor (ECF subfamily)